MKGKASGLLNKIISALASMARAKTLVIKSKTRALRARLIIFSLLSNKEFLASTISHKLHNVLTSHHRQDNKLKYSHDGGCGHGEHNDTEEDRAAVLYSHDSMAHHTVRDPTHTQHVKYDNLHYGYGGTGDDYEDEDDPRHSMFKSEEEMDDLLTGLEDPRESVIDLVKNSKQEAGEPFSLEDEIDQVADLFIERFYRQMRIQNQHSLKEFQEMLQRGL
ncbi:hypothetical protein SAY87_019776 [Trapa incisa]|uniref:DUF761 domain-containing protein n=1 Tax=Trapa incisa TaxID=236973 RepID=A0AAN7K0D1_9MYRT|nr:hypothetical protein SAY87_019776 [Trapa incisa]